MRFSVRRLTSFAGALLLVAASSTARASLADDAIAENNNGPPERVIIGLDLSTSNPLITNATYAGAAAELVAEDIKKLPMASVVMIRTFGSYSGQRNNLRIDRQVSSQRDEKPVAVAALVQEIISNVPKLVRDGTLQSQDRTNIVPFLEDMAEFVDCSKMDTTVILVSDGVEDSEYARLKDRNDSLPHPTSAPYRGCSELEIVGLGQGANSPSFTGHLRDEWSAWAKAAGFRNFDGLSDW
ncbi:MAG: hypothetical protein WAW96_07880 [Alphaproteobacteria bacterium]